jgi:hypothetical protein
MMKGTSWDRIRSLSAHRVLLHSAAFGAKRTSTAKKSQLNGGEVSVWYLSSVAGAPDHGGDCGMDGFVTGMAETTFVTPSSHQSA